MSMLSFVLFFLLQQIRNINRKKYKVDGVRCLKTSYATTVEIEAKTTQSGYSLMPSNTASDQVF